MAVENKYVNTDAAANNLVGAAAGGAEIVVKQETFEVAAADSDGSVYRVFKGLAADLILVDLKIANDAITGGTDWDAGFYETDLGAVVSKDCLLNGGDLSSAHARGSELSGMSAVDVANVKKSIYEIAGHTASTKKASYDLALTANTVGSGAGTVSVIATFARI